MEVSTNVKKLRQERNLTLRELADLSGWSSVKKKDSLNITNLYSVK